jgi:cytosine deaminase
MSEPAHVEKLNAVASLRRMLDTVDAEDKRYSDERFGIAVCKEALDAVAKGNYGVGCMLLDPHGRTVAIGGNQVFFPRFRSDQHAEMVVMNAFEDAFPEVSDLSGHVIHVSLEPCPMCVSRLIMSGVGVIKFVASDNGGGMARNLRALPDSFRSLGAAQKFVLADCSETVRHVASQAFFLNLPELRHRLLLRRSAFS